jgi:hypothetical protein
MRFFEPAPSRLNLHILALTGKSKRNLWLMPTAHILFMWFIMLWLDGGKWLRTL